MVLESGPTTKWTLNKDQKLRKELERLSESILQRASHSSRRCKEASNIVETKLIELDLLINNLERISSVQFVENRVAEDSSDAQTIEGNAQAATQDGEAQDIAAVAGFDLFDKVKESLKVATTSFEEIDVENEGRVDVLPSVIGTEEYVTNKYCGLEAIYGFGESEEDQAAARTSGSLSMYNDDEYMQPGGIDDAGASGASAFESDPFGTSASADPFSSESAGIAPPPPPPPQPGMAMAPALAAQDATQTQTTSRPVREKRVSGLHAQTRESTATAIASATDPAAAASTSQDDPFAADDPFGDDGATTAAAASAKPKSTYALSFDDIFGDDGDDGKDDNPLSTDNLFGTSDTTATTKADAFGSEKRAVKADSMEIPKAKQPASTLQASLAKILTESPSVGLFDESQNLKTTAQLAGGAEGPEVGADTNQTDQEGGRRSPNEENVFSSEHGFAATGSRALPGISTFANEIAARTKGNESKGNLASILSESPSVGLFDEDKVKSVISPEEPKEEEQTSLDRVLSVSDDNAPEAEAAPVVPNKRTSISVRDPFALARAKNQSESDSDGSFSSSDDFDDEDDGESDSEEQSSATNARSSKEEPPASVGEQDPFSFGTESSSLASKDEEDTPAKLPQPQTTTKRELEEKEEEVENPFSSKSSGLFGDDDDEVNKTVVATGGSESEQTKRKPKQEEKLKPFSSSSDAFADLFGNTSTTTSASRAKSSSLFEDPSEGGDKQAGKGSGSSSDIFGGSDLFGSSSQNLFETSEKEKKISKGLFDDFLDDSGDSKGGGGLFD